MSPEDQSRLSHILEAAQRIASYLDGVSRSDFLKDGVRQDAVIRRVQIIGEAARHLSPEALAAMPDFPARKARGMRHILVHDYDDVDMGMVWDTACQDIPALAKSVEAFLKR